MKHSNENEKRISSILGIGMDNDDGEFRLTRGENFALFGGSQETHEVMQETVVKVNENLEKRGKSLSETTQNEFRTVLCEVVESLNIKK
ncbi:MAG: hypothetical protein Q4D38_13365 [Planctomycetia bacterium]|nr:hypothetical protein [Planctomycetia bacterium]